MEGHVQVMRVAMRITCVIAVAAGVAMALGALWWWAFFGIDESVGISCGVTALLLVFFGWLGLLTTEAGS
jgi:hypothetical protein